MTERGFHPFAVLHFLRKTILLYLLPLLQVLFARNWAALRTALVQGAALLTVLAAVSAAVLHAGRWRVDTQGTLRVRWRLGVRLDRCLKAVHDRMDWDHKYPVREIGNGKVRAVGMGMAMQGSGIDHVDVGSATLKINDDGFYTLSIGDGTTSASSDAAFTSNRYLL